MQRKGDFRLAILSPATMSIPLSHCGADAVSQGVRSGLLGTGLCYMGSKVAQADILSAATISIALSHCGASGYAAVLGFAARTIFRKGLIFSKAASGVSPCFFRKTGIVPCSMN
jgi:hypothetical protein